MKKMISLLAAGLLVFCLAGCGYTGLNDHNVEIAQGVTAAADAYLDGETTAGAALADISALYDDIDDVEDGGVGYASIDRTAFQETVLKLMDELKADPSEEKVREYREKIAGYAGG